MLAVALVAMLGGYLVATGIRADAADPLLSQGRPATASSTENGGTPAANAVDGDNGTRWGSAFSDPQWLRVDLGATATVSRVVLRWEAAFARAFTVQTSADGTAWTTVYSTTTGPGGVQDLAVSGSGRYVRVNATQRATEYGVSLWEFQVYGAGGAPPPTRPPGDVVRVAEFLADCPFSHRLPDDPIVFPGLPGASHMHSFFGSRVTNAYTTVERPAQRQQQLQSLGGHLVLLDPDLLCRQPAGRAVDRHVLLSRRGGPPGRDRADPAAAAGSAHRRRERQGDRAGAEHRPVVLPAPRRRYPRRRTSSAVRPAA